jgi:hypothetical protein
MKPAWRGFRGATYLLQAALLALALLSTSLAASLAWRMHQESVAARGAGVLLLTTERRVPGPTGVEIFDGGWSRVESRAVAERLAQGFDVFALDRRLTSFGEAGRRSALLLIELALVGDQQGIPPALAPCMQGAVLASPSLMRVAQGQQSLGIEGSEHPVHGAAPEWLQWLAGTPGEAYALRCTRQVPGSAEQLLAIRRPGAARVADAASLEQDGTGILIPGGFERRIRVQGLHERVRQAIDARFAWVGATGVGSALVLLGLCLGVGTMQGLELRRHGPIRRALGARSRHLWRLLLRRSAALAGAAALLCLPALLWALARFAQFGLSLSLCLALLSTLAACSLLLIAAVAMRVDAPGSNSLLSGDLLLRAGSQISRTSLFVWVLGLSGACALGVTAVRLGEYAHALAHGSLGYRAEGLASVALRLPVAAQSGEALRSEVDRIRGWLRAESGLPGDWALVCNSPWHYASSPLHRDYGAGVGTFVGLSPGAMRVLGVRGGDLDEASWRDSRSLVLQTRSEAVRESLRSGWRVKAEVDGVLLGSSPPLHRTILFVPLPAMPACQDLEWVIAGARVDEAQLRALQQRLAAAFPALAVGPPRLVSEIIAAYRAPVTALNRLLLVACAGALAGQFVLALALTLLWTQAQSRATAVRRAFGATPARLLRGQLARLLPSTAIAWACSLPLAFVFQAAIAGALLDFPPLGPLLLAAWTLGLSAIFLGLTLAVWSLRLHRSRWMEDL